VNYLLKSRSSKSIQKNGNKQFVDLVYTKKGTSTKLPISITTRYNCQTFQATFANPQRVSHILKWSCHNVTKDEKCWIMVIYLYHSTTLKGMIKSLVPKILHISHEGFIITKEWIRQILKHYMNWYFFMATNCS